VQVRQGARAARGDAGFDLGRGREVQAREVEGAAAPHVPRPCSRRPLRQTTGDMVAFAAVMDIMERRYTAIRTAVFMPRPGMSSPSYGRRSLGPSGRGAPPALHVLHDIDEVAELPLGVEVGQMQRRLGGYRGARPNPPLAAARSRGQGNWSGTSKSHRDRFIPVRGIVQLYALLFINFSIC
jgi:hypothetical protein